MSDTTFITNEPGNTLDQRFDDLLGKYTRLFDCLVGYFYISGFYRIHPKLESVEHIRVLVGMQTDRSTYDLIQQARQGELPFVSDAKTEEDASRAALNELETSDDGQDIETGVQKFVEWIRSGKLEIRAHPTETIHAKLYIMTFGPTDRDKGRVVTGSSNLTQAGLQKNIEFNVELKNAPDYDYALSKFNELWKQGVDVSRPVEQTITKQSPYAQFTPYELYLKLLYEYFCPELNRQEDTDDVYIPAGFKKLKYQEEAVVNAKKVLEEYGGVFLSDVVGLGKTYMAAMLAKQLPGRHLVIAPPRLLDEGNRGSWPNVFREFGVRGYKCESVGKLDAIADGNGPAYDNVFIDEAHRFRTDTTQSYATLARICRGKRVILISATPLNNTPKDILSQLKLFQNGKASTIPNLRDLERFFANLTKRLEGLDRQKDSRRYLQIVKENAKETRERVLKYLMIRRTRTEIQKYYGEDMARQGLKFPEVKDPFPLFYQLNALESRVLDETVRLMVLQFKYARYQPLNYYVGDKDDSLIQGQINMVRFMRTLLVKRLESSFHAFRLTLARFIHSYEQMLEEYRQGNVYISKKHIHKVFEALEADDADAIDRLLEEDKAQRLSAKDFTPAFEADLAADLAILRRVEGLWTQITRDPKWLSFRTALTTDKQLTAGKLIIFTESSETADYLAACIKREVENRVILFSSHASEQDHQRVVANFDANVLHPRDDYRILVTTEVLAEGVNLHRSNTVINYDIPWNPTRLIQRVGRVNRVDTRFTSIHTYNFFPTEEANDIIKLKEAAEAKIHAFIEMLGADARLLTDGEEIKSHDLFTRLNSRRSLTGEDENEESELEYLTEIRQVRDENPALFSRIKRLPRKARSTRSVSSGDAPLRDRPCLLTYFRYGALDRFYLAAPGVGAPVELDFLATAKLLRPADPTEPRQAIGPDFYPLLERNKDAFARDTSAQDEDLTARRAGGAHERSVLARLRTREIRRYQGFTDEDEQYIQSVRDLLTDGVLPKAITKQLDDALKTEAEPLKVLAILRRIIPQDFFRPAVAGSVQRQQGPKEVILSSYIVEAS